MAEKEEKNSFDPISTQSIHHSNQIPLNSKHLDSMSLLHFSKLHKLLFVFLLIVLLSSSSKAAVSSSKNKAPKTIISKADNEDGIINREKTVEPSEKLEGTHRPIDILPKKMAPVEEQYLLFFEGFFNTSHLHFSCKTARTKQVSNYEELQILLKELVVEENYVESLEAINQINSVFTKMIQTVKICGTRWSESREGIMELVEGLRTTQKALIDEDYEKKMRALTLLKKQTREIIETVNSKNHRGIGEAMRNIVEELAPLDNRMSWLRKERKKPTLKDRIMMTGDNGKKIKREL